MNRNAPERSATSLARRVERPTPRPAFRRSLLITGLALLLIPLGGTARGERRVTVMGAGTARVRPDVVEVRGELIGTAPIAADAMTKYKESRRRFEEAVGKLGLANAKLVFGGVSITSGNPGDEMQGMVVQMGVDNGQTQVALNVTETVQIRVEGVDKATPDALFQQVLQLVDAAKDNGVRLNEQTNQFMRMQFGMGVSSHLAVFEVLDQDKVRRQAYELAMRDARSRAEHLATLAGAKLGAVLDIQEGEVAASADDASSQSLMMRIYGVEDDSKRGGFTSKSFGEIEVTAQMKVTFELQ